MVVYSSAFIIYGQQCKQQTVLYEVNKVENLLIKFDVPLTVRLNFFSQKHIFC
jgi:hypothetical protein